VAPSNCLATEVWQDAASVARNVISSLCVMLRWLSRVHHPREAALDSQASAAGRIFGEGHAPCEEESSNQNALSRKTIWSIRSAAFYPNVLRVWIRVSESGRWNVEQMCSHM
jgi:hypothetical protein